MIKDNTVLEYVANWIKNGFTCGYYPFWKLSFGGIQHIELSDATLNHISCAVSDGYVAGEVVEDNTSGWWKIESV